MVIRSVRHRGLRQLLENDNPGSCAQITLGELHISYETCEEYPLRLEFAQGKRRNAGAVPVGH